MLVRVIAYISIAYMMVPIVVVVASSFGTAPFPMFPPQGFTLKWFQKVMETQGLVDAAALSLKLAAVVSLCSVMIGSLSAVALTRFEVRGKSVLMAFFMSPIFFPAISLGLAILIFYSRLGLGSTFGGLVLAHTLLATPFATRLCLASLAETDWSIEEAARSLGAGPIKAFVTVVLPTIAPGVIAGALFAFIISFDELVVTLFLTGGSEQTLPVRIFNYIEYSNDPTVSAVCTLIIAVWLVIGVPAYRKFLLPVPKSGGER